MKVSVARNLAQEQTVTHPTPLSSKEIAYEIVEACQESKGKDVTAIDVTKEFGLSDYFIVVSARSDRQVQGIANRILESLDYYGHSPVTLEGMEKGHWVLMDWGDVVVHVFYEPLRAHYDIEGLWMNAPRVTFSRDKKGRITVKKRSARARKTAVAQLNA